MQSIAVFIPKTQSWMYWTGADVWSSNIQEAMVFDSPSSLSILNKVRETSPNPNLVVRILNEGA